MRFIRKLKNYLNQKFIIKYINNPYWKLADNYLGKVTTVLKKEHTELISKYFPGTDMEKEKISNLPYYNFINHMFSTYIYQIERCIVEPDYYWLILGNKKIFRYSYPLIEDPFDGVKPRPFLLNRLIKRNKRLESGILISFSWNNYYHFMADLLPQILLCDDSGIPDDVPLIVPYNYNKNPFVNNYFKNFPSKRRIIIQEKGQYIEVKKLFVAKDHYCSSYLTDIKETVIKSSISDTDSLASPKFIFVTRKKEISRGMSNVDEIEQIAKEQGFTIIDPGNYSWQEQVAFFSGAERIIGIHGAGLTNIIFSKNINLKLLEIHPGQGHHPGHYKDISILLKYDYCCMYGNGLDAHAQFHLDAQMFKHNLKVFMK